MPITAEYDREADALYVRLREGDRLRAVEIDDRTYVDVDAEGRALGVEVLYPAMGLDLTAAVARFSLQRQLPEIIAAVAASGAPVPTQTMTTGQHLASTTTIMVAVEGTLYAGGPALVTGTSQADRLVQVPAGCDAG